MLEAEEKKMTTKHDMCVYVCMGKREREDVCIVGCLLPAACEKYHIYIKHTHTHTHTHTHL